MSTKIYVGNLPYMTTEADVRQLFKKYEPLHSVILISDRDTGVPRGFGFIELDESLAKTAICEMRNMEYHGRFLKVGSATGKDPQNPQIPTNFMGGGKDCEDCVICHLLKKMIYELNATHNRKAHRSGARRSPECEYGGDYRDGGGAGFGGSVSVYSFGGRGNCKRGSETRRKTVRIHRDPNRGNYKYENQEIQTCMNDDAGAPKSPLPNDGPGDMGKHSGYGVYQTYRFSNHKPEYNGKGWDKD